MKQKKVTQKDYDLFFRTSYSDERNAVVCCWVSTDTGEFQHSSRSRDQNWAKKNSGKADIVLWSVQFVKYDVLEFLKKINWLYDIFVK